MTSNQPIHANCYLSEQKRNHKMEYCKKENDNDKKSVDRTKNRELV